MNLFNYDLMDIDYKKVCGIDEAGRGPIAGSLVVVGVVLYSNIMELDDSKKLTSKTREKLYEKIIKNSKYYIYEAKASKIDEIGLSKCLKEALIEIQNYFGNTYTYIFDGNCNYGETNINTLVKADSKIKSVSAASIIAKVYRDRQMIEFDKKYPNYGFKSHKGYGTKAHIEAIKEFRYCEIHRRSFKVKGINLKD